MARAARTIAASAFVALVAVVRPSLAEPTTPVLDLTWSAPAACPDQASVVAGVDRLVTKAPAQPLRVQANVREADSEWVLDLELHGSASGSRTIRASSCVAVARAASLIIALALDPQAAARASEALADPPPAPPPKNVEPAPSAPTSPAPPTPASPDGARARELVPFVHAGGALERAILPGAAPAFVFGGGIVWRALRVELAAELAPHARASLGRADAIGADFALLGATLRGCAGPTFTSVAIHGCAAVRGARMTGEGAGVTEAYRPSATLLSLAPGLVARVPGRTALGVEVGVEAVLPVTRPSFVVDTRAASATTGVAPVDSAESLYRVSAIGARASIGLSYRF